MPIFGNSEIGIYNETRIGNRWSGSIFLMTNEEGRVAELITVAVEGYGGTANRLRASLYEYNPETRRWFLVAQTEIRQVAFLGFGSPQWENFNFPEPKPQLVANKEYAISIGGLDDVETRLRQHLGACEGCGVGGNFVGDSFPPDFAHMYPTNNVSSIYCTYNGEAPPPPPEHTITIQSTPVNVPVTVDGSPKGDTPVNAIVKEGEHVVSVPTEVEI